VVLAPIRIKTGRYENLKENKRIFPFCDCDEDEIHVLLYCNLYADVRQSLFDKAVSIKDARSVSFRSELFTSYI